MNWEKSLSSVAVIIPLAHLLVCFLYVCGYAAGFGSNVGSFFDAGDLFSTAAQNLSVVYFTGLVVPIALLSYMHVTKSIPLVGTVDFEGKPEQFAATTRRVEGWYKPIGLGLFQGVILIQVIWLVNSYVYSERFPYGLFQSILIIVYFRYFFDTVTSRGWPALVTGAIWVGIALPLAALVSGLNAGQTDRREGVATLALESATCSGLVVRRKVGDLYVAIGKDEKRMLIDDDCKVKLLFPNKARFGTVDENALWWEKRKNDVSEWFSLLW